LEKIIRANGDISIGKDCDGQMFFTLEEYVQSMAELYKSPQQGFENLSKNYLKRKEDLICCIIEAEKIVEREEKEQKEAEEKCQAKLACIAAAKAAAPTI